MTDSIKVALIIGEKCLDVKGLALIQGEGYIILQDSIDIVAGELSQDLLQELELQRRVPKLKRSHVP